MAAETKVKTEMTWQSMDTAPIDRPILVLARRPGDPNERIVAVHRYSGMWAIYGCGKSQECLDVVEPSLWVEIPPRPLPTATF